MTTHLVQSRLRAAAAYLMTTPLELCEQHEVVDCGVVQSGFVDAASPQAMGRITVWANGETIYEIIDSQNEAFLMYEYLLITTEAEFQARLAQFAATLLGPPDSAHLG